MKVRLKSIERQVMVITGATSGIGLVTARLAARYGARLVLSARNEEALGKLVDEIKQNMQCDAVAVVADVGQEADVRRIADRAIERFGSFDTWVNNAGVSVYGRLEQVPIEDHRRLFETNFWGIVYGSLVAAGHLRLWGGAIVNIGSILSDRALPLQGMYSASKHAVKGFTDALRMELEEEGAPISVTLIKPSAIDTPYPHHARNYLGVEPKNPPPVYAPETVADAILHAAQKPVRDIVVGGGGRAVASIGYLAPRVMDKVMEATMFRQQRSNRPDGNHPDSLYGPTEDLRERGGYQGHVFESSAYTRARLHPLLTSVVLVGAGLAIGAIVNAMGQR